MSPKKKTSEDFIKEAKAVHGDKYDYSEAEYKNYHTKLKILCSLHGEFFQSPANHLKGHGCIECGGKRKLHLSEFINKANKKHNYRYSYSNTIYKKTDIKIEIICSKHGSFFMTPHNHLAGQNCPLCLKESKGRTQRLSNKEFIKKAKSIHGDEYDYRNTIYKGYDSLIEIICSKHGVFTQEASNHLQGKGCNECYGKVAYSNKSFIKKANEVHKNLYDYSFINYQNNYSKVVISCNVHGQFLQSPANHLKGQGCPSCGKEINAIGDTLINIKKNKKYLPGIFYVLEMFNDKEHFFKVGITSNSVKKRYNTNKLMPYDYEILLEADIGMVDAYENERYLLQEFSNYKYIPKIKFNGKEECLSINPIEHDERLKEYINHFKEL